jgi:hypothetical protein
VEHKIKSNYQINQIRSNHNHQINQINQITINPHPSHSLNGYSHTPVLRTHCHCANDMPLEMSDDMSSPNTPGCHVLDEKSPLKPTPCVLHNQNYWKASFPPIFPAHWHPSLAYRDVVAAARYKRRGLRGEQK